ncbi:MAG: ATP-dependent helicase [Candidatus Nanopelagicales bacterium]
MVPRPDPQQSLADFNPLTREWFQSAFAAPTAAQVGAWDAIRRGAHTLVVAPTGSGKTLAAFLAAIDRLSVEPAQSKKHRARVLYVSPLKALASDVERNLRSPLNGLRREAGRAKVTIPDITVGIRTGDTPAGERRRQASAPPDIWITTPESLFLLLTSQARESLRGIDTVIIDEVHAVAGTKRGAHLAVSLERLDVLLRQPAQRIGLSATVQPIDEVALFLAGGRPVDIVNPPSDKRIELSVVVPIEDMTAPMPRPSDKSFGDELDDAPETPSIWPHVENGIVDLIEAHTSTLVFANSRRLAERLTARINEIHAERTSVVEASAEAQAALDVEEMPTKPPAQIMAGSGSSAGAATTLARAHHGSVSKEQRALIEDDLKAGRIPAVVATSSLELGIDMGAVDLVVQVEAPPSVASGLQRAGRAGHQVGETSRAVVFPKHRGDLLAAAVVINQMNERKLEATRIPRNPLDVLAQQIIAAVSIDEVNADELLALVRRSAPFGSLPQSAYDAVLDMLAGRYPSDGFSELRPRVVWDRSTNTLTSRPGAQRLAVTSGGTIPDRGLFAVFLVGEKASRVGELDEEMVYESRVGDVIALGASSWRIEEITHDRVLVSPAPGQTGRLPFWHGDALGRPVELGRAIGAATRSMAEASREAATELLRDQGLDTWAAENLVRYVHEQKDATEHVPDDRTMVVERFRDELGDWRLVLHSPFGARVHAPWALAIADRVREVVGVDAQVMHADDGIVLRLPDTDDDAAIAAATEALFPDPEDINELVTAAVGGSALFASRFRECAARALLLPRRDPDKRSPLWQQRQRSAQLLSVASQYPSFPIVIETVRECLQDVFDVPALIELLREVRNRSIRVEHVVTPMPSPFARTLLFSYVASFLYEGDSPLAERRAAALTLDTELLAELLGYVELRELLDPTAMAEVEAEIGYLTEQRAARSMENTADMLRMLGPLAAADWSRRGVKPGWLRELVTARRAVDVRIAGEDRVAAIEDAGRLRDALGAALPVGLPEAFLEGGDDPLAELIARYARTHGPFTTTHVAEHFGIGTAVAQSTLGRLAANGRVVSGEFRPDGLGTEWCDVEVLRRLRRRSIAALRQEAEPVSPASLGVFLPTWSGITRPGRGTDAVLQAVERLAGAAVPASALESMILPARVANYEPAMLDELTSAGEVSWCGRGRLPGGDGWVCLAPAETAELLLPLPNPDPIADPAAVALLDVLNGGGAWLFRELRGRVEIDRDSTLLTSLWDLVWSGRITADTFAPLRASLGRGTNDASGSGGRTRTSSRNQIGAGSRTRAARLARANLASRVGSPSASGRWAAVPDRSTDHTRRSSAMASALLERYGVVTRGAVAAEDLAGGFAAMYRVLSVLEDAGRTRRGYFVEGLGAAQFASPGAVDQLRLQSRRLGEPAMTDTPETVLLAACDPANPYGAALPWPLDGAAARGGHRPGRKSGALVVLVNGQLAVFVEKGGRSLLTFTTASPVRSTAFAHLAKAALSRRIPGLRIERCDGVDVRGADALAELEAAGFVLTPKGARVRS